MSLADDEPGNCVGDAVSYVEIPLLETIRRDGKTWDVAAPQYGVTNPEPPWKTSLVGTCESLAVAGVVPGLERRRAEDALGETLYCGLPGPEHQLLSLAHLMMVRELITENHLAEKMAAVRNRLTTGG